MVSAHARHRRPAGRRARPRRARARRRARRGDVGAAPAQAGAGPRELVELARALVPALAIPVLVNDRPDVALAAGAAGVHLGPDDLPVALARRIAPPGFVIGASVGSRGGGRAGAAQADYWGIGPWRATSHQGRCRGRARRRGLRAGWRALAAAGRASRSAACMPEDVPLVLRRGRQRRGGGVGDPGRGGRGGRGAATLRRGRRRGTA